MTGAGALTTATPAPVDVRSEYVDAALAAKSIQRVSVCVPARNEEATITHVVDVVVALRDLDLVDEIVVVDDGSTDRTARRAREAGATVVPAAGGPGKGQALAAAVDATSGDLVVFVDADVVNFSPRFVARLLIPLLTDEAIQMVKGAYRRPFLGRAGEGGRVTELLARPLLRRFFPELAGLSQPLAGESALRRETLGALTLADGYGVEIGLLLDVYRRFGRGAIAEVDLGERVHRNRPLEQLRPHADDIVAALFERIPLPDEGARS